jgi:hypothetical protein
MSRWKCVRILDFMCICFEIKNLFDSQPFLYHRNLFSSSLARKVATTRKFVVMLTYCVICHYLRGMVSCLKSFVCLKSKFLCSEFPIKY